MDFFILGIFVLGAAVLFAPTQPERVLGAAIVLTSFGMFAAFRLPIGNLTPLASHAVAGLGTLVMTIAATRHMARGGDILMPRGAIPLLLFAIYAVIASLVFPRFFAGNIDVFSWSREATGERVDTRFPARLSPLSPSTSNISQTFYLILSVTFFFAMTAVIRRKGAEFAVHAIRLAALANIVLAILSIVAPQALSFVRTADYALLDFHIVVGLPRIIGGFPEASGFGSHSAVLAAFLVATGRPREVILGAANLMLAAGSLSSTGVFGFFVAGIVLAVCLFSVKSGYRVMHFLAATLLGLAALTILVFLTIDTTMLGNVLERLAFSKTDSASGMERGAMMLKGFEVFRESFGLGAGLGATRANGFPSAVLAAVGIPGAVLFNAFLVSMVINTRNVDTRRANAEHDDPGNDQTLRSIGMRAAICGMATSLAVQSLSSFSVDPGLLFMTFAAIAATRSQARISTSEEDRALTIRVS